MTLSTNRAVGYARVSTAEQADAGAGLAAQRAAIASECDRRGWTVVRLCEDAGASAKTLKRRPQLAAAMALIEAGQADTLVVSRLDRLSRSIVDFATLMERARSKGWSIVVLDCDFDMTSPTGELMANMLACFAQFERRLIGQRTKDALAIKRRQGVVLGRPSKVPSDLRQAIASARSGGSTLQAIADDLNERGVPTAQGGKRWHPSTVRAVLNRAT